MQDGRIARYHAVKSPAVQRREERSVSDLQPTTSRPSSRRTDTPVPGTLTAGLVRPVQLILGPQSPRPEVFSRPELAVAVLGIWRRPSEAVTRCRVYAAQVDSLTHLMNTLLNGNITAREPQQTTLEWRPDGPSFSTRFPKGFHRPPPGGPLALNRNSETQKLSATCSPPTTPAARSPPCSEKQGSSQGK
jgi:hypothetical protein